MDRAQQPFDGRRARRPVLRHLRQPRRARAGQPAANAGFEPVATGCMKPMSPASPIPTRSAARSPRSTPRTCVAAARPTRPSVALVPPDPKRQYVSKAQYKQSSRRQPGRRPRLRLRRPGRGAASGGAAGYYSWSPQPGIRFIALDTVSRGRRRSAPRADGNIDDPQFQWLEGAARGGDGRRRARRSSSATTRSRA